MIKQSTHVPCKHYTMIPSRSNHKRDMDNTVCEHNVAYVGRQIQVSISATRSAVSAIKLHACSWTDNCQNHWSYHWNNTALWNYGNGIIRPFRGHQTSHQGHNPNINYTSSQTTVFCHATWITCVCGQLRQASRLGLNKDIKSVGVSTSRLKR